MWLFEQTGSLADIIHFDPMLRAVQSRYEKRDTVLALKAAEDRYIKLLYRGDLKEAVLTPEQVSLIKQQHAFLFPMKKKKTSKDGALKNGTQTVYQPNERDVTLWLEAVALEHNVSLKTVLNIVRPKRFRAPAELE